MIVDAEAKEIVLGAETFPLNKSVNNIADFFSITDSGLLPTNGSGVILHRKGLGSEQIVYQYAPSIRSIGYKKNEGDYEMNIYSVAFPYWIACIAFEAGAFRGIRHFYSPKPIMYLDQELYLPNVPNTNTRGYNHTSVGWVCLYHNHVEEVKNMREKLDYALARHDPLGEPYNYGNMSGTDGYTSYKAHKPKLKHLYNPTAWQEKTEADGIEWTLEEDLWIPFYIANTDTYAERNVFVNDETNFDDIKQYTLRDAIYNPHYVYYNEQGAVQLNDFIAKTDDEQAEFVQSYLRHSVVSGIGASVAASNPTSIKAPPKEKTAEDLLSDIPKNEMKKILKLLFSVKCATCLTYSDHMELPEADVFYPVKPFIAKTSLLAPDWVTNGINNHEPSGKIYWCCPGCKQAGGLIKKVKSLSFPSKYPLAEFKNDTVYKIITSEYKSNVDGSFVNIEYISAPVAPLQIVSAITGYSWVNQGAVEEYITHGVPETITICAVSYNWDLNGHAEKCKKCNYAYSNEIPGNEWKVYSKKNVKYSQAGCIKCTPKTFNLTSGFFVAWDAGALLQSSQYTVEELLSTKYKLNDRLKKMLSQLSPYEIISVTQPRAAS